MLLKQNQKKWFRRRNGYKVDETKLLDQELRIVDNTKNRFIFKTVGRKNTSRSRTHDCSKHVATTKISYMSKMFAKLKIIEIQQKDGDSYLRDDKVAKPTSY